MALHLLAILVLPWAAAPLAWLLGRRAGIGLALVTAMVQCALALFALPADVFRMGGVVLAVTDPARFFLPVLLVTLVVACVLADDDSPHFVPVALLLDGAVAGVTLVDSIFLAVLLLELAGIAALLLLPARPRQYVPAARTSQAGARYLALTVVSTTLLIAASSLIETYRVGGENHDLSQAILALLATGISIRLAAFPFQVWLSDFVASVPMSVVAITCTTVSVAAYALIFLLLSGSPWLLLDEHNRDILANGAALGAFGGAILAVFAPDLRRLTAYTITTEAGFILFGIATGTLDTISAALALILANCGTVVALAVLVSQLERTVGTIELGAVRGLIAQLPMTAFGFLIAGLSAGGFPLLANFPYRWTLWTLAGETSPVTAMMLVAASALLLFAFVRAFRLLFLGPPPAALVKRESTLANAALAVLALYSLVLGLAAGPLLMLLSAAVGDLPFAR